MLYVICYMSCIISYILYLVSYILYILIYFIYYILYIYIIKYYYYYYYYCRVSNIATIVTIFPIFFEQKVVLCWDFETWCKRCFQVHKQQPGCATCYCDKWDQPLAAWRIMCKASQWSMQSFGFWIVTMGSCLTLTSPAMRSPGREGKRCHWKRHVCQCTFDFRFFLGPFAYSSVSKSVSQSDCILPIRLPFQVWLSAHSQSLALIWCLLFVLGTQSTMHI